MEVNQIVPAVLHFPLAGNVLGALRAGHNGHPLLHQLLGNIRFFAEQRQVLLCHIALAAKGKGQVGAGRVRRGVALGGMCPVADVQLAVGTITLLGQ